MQVKFKFNAISAATAMLVATSVLVACGGGGGGSAAVTTAVPVAGAGNSPFIGVTMKAECANGTSGTGVIGTSAAPGDGTITVAGTCTPPIKITAISRGFMRPLGSTSDVIYDPAINMPIANMLDVLPTAAAPATANPVTTLVADQLASPATETSANITTAKGKVASSLGIASTDGDYRSPEIAAASTRLAQVVALAVQKAALAPPAVVTAGTKTLGQFVAEKIAAAATAAGTLNTAANIATKLNTGADAAAGKIDVTTNAKVTGTNATAGSIDRDAALVKSIVTTVANTKGVVGASVAELLTQIKDSTDATVTAGVAEHIQAAKTNEISNKSVRLVLNAQANANANANSATSVKTEADTRLAAVQAAVAKVNNALTIALANSATPTVSLDALAHYDTVLSAVDAALTKDATATTKIFAAPPTVGVKAAVDALVANIEKQTSMVTAGGTAPSTTALTGYATTALTVAKVIADLAPPPVPGTGAVTQVDADAYRAAIAAIATKLGDAAATVDKTALQASVDALKAATQTAISGVTSLDVDIVELAQKAAETAVASAQDNFTTPPTPGSVATVTPPQPPATNLTPPPDVPMTVVTKAQQDEAIAQSAKATTAATAAATQATAAATAASAASAASTVPAAQTAANDAQAAATAAHKARVEADAASAAAAKAYPNSPAATDAATKAAAAATADAAAAASASAATASYNTLVATLQAEQLAAAQAAQAAAETAASTAATKAQEAAGFASSATAATTAAVAQTATDGAQAAATAAQAAADTAKTQAGVAAAQLPGSPQANAASSAATTAQASATAAKASAATAAARVVALTTTTTTTTSTTTTSTTTTTLPVQTGTLLDLAATVVSPFDSKGGIGVNDATGAANYTGAAIQFGPYTISGAATSTAVTLPGNAGLQAFTTFSVNGSAFGTTGSVSSGDTVLVKFDLATYIANFNSGPLTYAAKLTPKIKIGTPTVALELQMCGDPTLPPGVGNSVCK